MNRMSGVIRTPDQRLRVFVSSTLEELASERGAARNAIERLRLAPVMFELGARPHPPAELYRAYLRQSHVFVGLYWERYGWVAPGEDISGLEDEYNLASSLPKLIYIKRPAVGQEDRLAALLDRILVDGTASFKFFTTARQLRALIEADLATLLAERFEQGAAADDVAEFRAVPRDAGGTDAGGTGAAGTDAAFVEPKQGAMPTPLTELIGRESEAAAVGALLRRDPVRLVTLTGPGGIGKSRLAVEVGKRVGDAFSNGVFFVDLSPVSDAAMVPAAIAQAIGVRDTGDRPVGEKLAVALRDRQNLLVLDNFEQVLPAAPGLLSLLAACPGLKLLVTSRTILRISGEHGVEVGPLDVRGTLLRPTVDDASRRSAVALFVERARAVKPEFDLVSDNVEAVTRICAALDGVPLALELAAARIRILSPSAMLNRLDRQLPLLAGGVRDLPKRQQALRSTIDWSVDLLDGGEKLLLARLGVFVGGFSLEAAEAVCGGGAETDVLSDLEALVDNSLVRQHDRGQESRFTMLATVREYALEMLEASGELAQIRQCHADYFLRLSEQAEGKLRGPLQREWVGRLTDDRDNLGAVARYLLEAGDLENAARFAWNLYLYWWVGGHLGEVRGWMDEVLAAGGQLPNLAKAEALYFTRAITFWQDPDGVVIPGLTESAELFRRESRPSGEAIALVSLALAVLAASTPDPARADSMLETSLARFREAGDRWGESMALVSLGRVALLQQKAESARSRFEESLALTRLERDELSAAITIHHLGWTDLVLGDVVNATARFEEALVLSARLSHEEGIAYGLEGLVAVAAASGDVARTGMLLGAAESLREHSGVYNAPNFSFHQPAVDRLLTAGDSVEFGTARAEGRAMSLRTALDFALPSELASAGSAASGRRQASGGGDVGNNGRSGR